MEFRAFSTYLQHLYTDRLLITKPNSIQRPTLIDILVEYSTLARLYTFGEKIGDVTFKNTVLDSFVQKLNNETIDVRKYYCLSSTVDVFYEGTTTGSPARRLMVDMHASSGYPNWISGLAADINEEFLVDLSRNLLEDRVMREGQHPPPFSIEAYHEANVSEKMA